MSCSITILSTETAFHSPTVVVTTEYSRFLFDIGEGTQRLVAEHKVRLGKVHAVCTTSSQVHSVGGLTGQYTVSSNDTTCLTFHIYRHASNAG